MSRNKKRAMKQAPTETQVDLFDRPPAPVAARQRQMEFNDPDPRCIVIGSMTLERYLNSHGLEEPLVIREFLRSLDWTAFEKSYQLTGRAPYAPVCLVGLILYGLLKGQQSLRVLERLARLDLGAMWVCGGLQPDHSCLARFIMRFHELLTEPFFEELTQGILTRLGLRNKSAAVDGTIMAAAGSRFRVIKLEAAQLAAQKAKDEAAADPKNETLQDKAERAAQVAKAAEERAEHRRANGDSVKDTKVCTTEPEAPVLKGKRGQVTPAYVPSVAATKERIIAAQHVEPTSEQEAIKPLLEQIARVAPSIETILADSNYDRGPVLQTALERNVDILCPPSTEPEPIEEAEKLGKEHFRYDEANDQYICPKGQTLERSGTSTDKRRNVTAITYRSNPEVCAQCPLFAKCIGTPAKAADTAPKRDKTRKAASKPPKAGKTRKARKAATKASKANTPRKVRVIQRFPTDELREALQKVMEHPLAQRRLNRRKVMVEPVFSALRGVQGLIRFHRWGLKGVRVEFALHACAHNLGRLIALLRRQSLRARPQTDRHSPLWLFLYALWLHFVASYRQWTTRSCLGLAR